MPENHLPIIGVRGGVAELDYGDTEVFIVDWDNMAEDLDYADDVLDRLPEDHPYRSRIVKFIERVWGDG